MLDTSPSLQNDDVKNKIRTAMLGGKEILQIQNEMEIPAGTWDACYWRNTQGFRDFIDNVKKQRFLKSAEAVSEEITNIDAQGSAKLLAIKQKEAEFLRETLGKDMGYSKRIETIGFNVNKTEPLDDEQRKKIDKLLNIDKKEVIDVTGDVLERVVDDVSQRVDEHVNDDVIAPEK